VNQGFQVVGIGFLQVRIIGIEPLDGNLQRPAGVEAAGPRGAVDVLLRLKGGCVEVGPVGCQKGEVGHSNFHYYTSTSLRADTSNLQIKLATYV